MDVSETVWILGAGFSFGLGAPLFRDLFRNIHRVRAAYQVGGPTADMVRTLRLYRQHAGGDLEPGEEHRGRLWGDPEEFLDAIESATLGTGAADLLRAAGFNAPQVAAEMARRALAIECAHFLRGANVEAERWLPYRTWVDRLGKNDTVVSFNYDCVPDLLAHRGENPPIPGKCGRLKIVLPGQFAQSHIAGSRQDPVPVVLKLHGSVNWVKSPQGIVVNDAPTLPISDDGANLFMAIPGPGKDGMRKREEMVPLWEEAIAAIERAHKIVFLGYRFPPTDAQARVDILAAIKVAAQRNLSRVRVVLGPNERHPDIARMRSLFNYVVAPSLVEVVPLFAEDFLSLEP